MSRLTSSFLVAVVAILPTACGSGAAKTGGVGMGGTAAAAGANGSAGWTGADAAAGAGHAADAGAGGGAAGEATGAAAPVQLAAAPGCGAVRLTLAGATIFWTEHATGAVKSLATANPGGVPTVVATHQLAPGSISADDTAIYWANEGDKTVMKAPLEGGAPAPLLTAPDVVHGVLASGGNVFYGAGASTYKVARAGGTPTTLMTFATCRTSTPSGLALDVDYVYQTDLLHQFLTRGKLDGTQMSNDPCAVDPTTAPKILAPETITHTQGALLMDTLALVAGQLIWADGANVNGRPVAGGAAATGLALVHTANDNPVTGFVVSGADIYLGETSETSADPNGNAIERAPLAAGDAGANEATVLATGQRGASELAADATSIYWATKTPPTTVDGIDVASSPTCTANADGVCCGTKCAPNDCAIMKLAR